MEIDLAGDLVKLEVADEDVASLCDVRKVKGKIAVAEDAFTAVKLLHIILDKIAFGH